MKPRFLNSQYKEESIEASLILISSHAIFTIFNDIIIGFNQHLLIE